MTFLAILKMSAAVFTIAFGLYSVIRPRAIKSFTGLDVTETDQTVEVTVHAGVVPSARCPRGVSLLIGTAWLRVRLRSPLGSRSLSDPAL